MHWNPWHGCQKISPGCANCYVYRRDSSFSKDSSQVEKTASFSLPVKRNRYGIFKLSGEDTVYTCLSSDFFLPEADEWRKEAWDMIRTRKDARFFIITKRIDRFFYSLPEDWGDGWENVTIGCTVENQDRADYRLPIFLTMPIAHKQIICEPLLESLDLSSYLGKGIEQVVVGGESGPKARICDYEWVLTLREQCQKAGTSFYFKQTGAKFKKNEKVFSVPRNHQMTQAEKAGINLH